MPDVGQIGPDGVFGAGTFSTQIAGEAIQSRIKSLRKCGVCPALRVYLQSSSPYFAGSGEANSSRRTGAASIFLSRPAPPRPEGADFANLIVILRYRCPALSTSGLAQPLLPRRQPPPSGTARPAAPVGQGRPARADRQSGDYGEFPDGASLADRQRVEQQQVLHAQAVMVRQRRLRSPAVRCGGFERSGQLRCLRRVRDTDRTAVPKQAVRAGRIRRVDRAGHRADRTAQAGRVVGSVEGPGTPPGFHNNGGCRRVLAISRFRCRNRQRVGADPGGTSAINRPRSATVRSNSSLPAG